MYKCRACLVKCEEDKASCMDLADKLLPSVFSNVSIRDALSEVACISITPDPHQPSKICCSCRCRLQDAYLFIKRVQESAAIIQQCSIENPLPNHPIDSASMLCEVGVKVERDDTSKMNTEIDSDFNSAPVEPPDSNYTEFIAENETKLEPKDEEKFLNANAFYKVIGCVELDNIDEIKMETNEEQEFSDQNCENPLSKSESKEEYNALFKVLNLFEDSLSDNDESNQEDVVKCACQNFQKADYTCDETESTIQGETSNMQDINDSYIRSLLQIAKCKSNIEKKISNMQFFQKNLYIKSLMHICKCGSNATNEKNSNGLEKIVYTLECNDTYISVSREMFIQVFGLKERTLQLLEKLVNLKQKHSKKSIKEVSYQNNGQIMLKSASNNSIQEMDESERTEFTDALMNKYCIIKPGTPQGLVFPVRRKSIDPQKEEERAKRRKELTRERVRRYRERQRIKAPEKVKQLIMVSDIPRPSHPLNTLVREEAVMDEMKDIIKNQLMKNSNNETNEPEAFQENIMVRREV